MNVIIVSLVLLGVIGLIAAVLLYGASVKFKVEENPKIAEIEEVLPGANCGGCGLTGCHAFAVACAEATSLENLHCTGGLTKEGLEKIAEITVSPLPRLREKWLSSNARIPASSTIPKTTTTVCAHAPSRLLSIRERLTVSIAVSATATV